MRGTFLALLGGTTQLYVGGLLLWAVLYALIGDRWWWMFLLCSLAFYLFLPLLVVPAVAYATRSSLLWAGFGLAALLWAVLYGGLYVAPASADAALATPTLRVMTYNMLRHNEDGAAVVAAIHASDADVVAIQELNVPVAGAIAQDLNDQYPYQLLEPGIDRAGMGIVSRYPLTNTDAQMPGGWISPPQVVQVALPDAPPVTLFNVHLSSTSLGYGGNLRLNPDQIEQSVRAREQQVRTLLATVKQQTTPVIVMGDFNTTELSYAYQMMRDELHDAWRVAGYGTGHTFPGATTPGGSRPRLLGIPVPGWLVRIDYVFYSGEWQARRAVHGPWDGQSDHRPVLVDLALTGR